MNLNIGGNNEPQPVSLDASKKKYVNEHLRSYVSKEQTLTTPDGRSIVVNVRVYTKTTLEDLSEGEKHALNVALNNKIEHVKNYIFRETSINPHRKMYFDFLSDTGKPRGIKVRERSSGDHVSYPWKLRKDHTAEGKKLARTVRKAMHQYDKVTGFRNPNMAVILELIDPHAEQVELPRAAEVKPAEKPRIAPETRSKLHNKANEFLETGATFLKQIDLMEKNYNLLIEHYSADLGKENVKTLKECIKILNENKSDLKSFEAFLKGCLQEPDVDRRLHLLSQALLSPYYEKYRTAMANMNETKTLMKGELLKKIMDISLKDPKKKLTTWQNDREYIHLSAAEKRARAKDFFDATQTSPIMFAQRLSRQKNFIDEMHAIYTDKRTERTDSPLAQELQSASRATDKGIRKTTGEATLVGTAAMGPLQILREVEEREPQEIIRDLVDLMASDHSQGLSNEMLISYKAVVSSQQLFDAVSTLMYDPSISTEKKENLANFTIKWLERNQSDKALNKELKSTLGYIQTACFPPHNQSSELNKMGQKIQSGIANLNVRFQAQPLAPSAPTIGNFLIEAMGSSNPNPKQVNELVQELKTIFMEDMANVTHEQILAYNYDPKSAADSANNKVIAPGVNKTFTDVQQLANWVVDQITSCDSPKKSQALIKFFMEVMQKSNTEGAFMVGHAIYRGLRHTAVDRLASPELIEKVKIAGKLYDPSKSYKLLKDAAKQFEGKPVLLMYELNRDIQVLKERVPNTIEGNANIEKMVMYSKTAEMMPLNVIRKEAGLRKHNLDLGDALTKTYNDQVFLDRTQRK